MEGSPKDCKITGYQCRSGDEIIAGAQDFVDGKFPGSAGSDSAFRLQIVKESGACQF
jgi:hypothetical protein